MTTALRIGLLTPGWPGTNTPNGIATSVHHLATGLHALGATPVIIGPTDGPAPADIPHVVKPAVRWTLLNKVRAKLSDPSELNNRLELRCIAQAIRTAHARHGLDLVIMEETKGWPADVIPAVPVPVVINLHGPWALLSEAFERPLTDEDHQRIAREAESFAMTPGILAPSASSMSVTEGLAPETPRAVIPNAYAAAPPADAARQKRGHILYVGRVDRLKGADTVLKAFEALAARHGEAHLTFVGPDHGLLLDDGRMVPMDEALAELAPRSRARITFLGQQDGGSVAALRRSHPIALIASRYENLNYSLLEALSAGQAIVATAVGGPAEVLEDGRTALLVPPADPDAMAGALERLLCDNAARQALAAEGRDLLARRFDPKVVAKQTLEFCETVLAHQSHP